MKMKGLITKTIVFLLAFNAIGARAQHDTCRVALMVPLYLEQVDRDFFDAEPSNRTLATKPFSFLHFYEGFMIAADSMANSRGMNVELKVYDVDSDIKKADTAVIDPWLKTADLIVGPFHLKPFNVVKQFAVENNIPIVNPITQRSEIIDNQPNVIKVKPSMEGQLRPLDSLVKNYYHNNNIFIIRQNRYGDTAIINKINKIAERNIDSCAYVENSYIVKTIKKHQKRWKYLNVAFEKNDYLTDNVSLNVDSLSRCIDDTTVFYNKIININYYRDSLNFVKDYASTMRNNLFIVYGSDKVFANEIVNKVTKLTEYYPITVVMLPEWSKFTGLFNDNLMKMHAIYFDDNNIDYQNIRVESFICKFRNRYETEPSLQAYEGFDIGWYFLNALNVWGEYMMQYLPDFSIPLLHTHFYFQRNAENSGYENTFWNVYQFKGYNKIVLNNDYEK